jgi:hypothetical protein
MKANYTKALKIKIAKSAKEGALIGLTIGAIVGGAIGVSIFGVGAIANAAICGAIGLAIGAGIGALIIIIKAEREARRNLALPQNNGDDSDEEPDDAISSENSLSLNSEQSIEESFDDSSDIKASAKSQGEKEKPKFSKNRFGFKYSERKSLSDSDLILVAIIPDEASTPKRSF